MPRQISLTDILQYMNPISQLVDNYYRNNYDYDMQAYIDKYGVPDRSKGKHLTDEFKKPNHMTFSDESVYNTPEMQGGKWEQRFNGWDFYASPFNLQQHSPEELKDYFNRSEKNSQLIFPIPYRSDY